MAKFDKRAHEILTFKGKRLQKLEMPSQKTFLALTWNFEKRFLLLMSALRKKWDLSSDLLRYGGHITVYCVQEPGNPGEFFFKRVTRRGAQEVARKEEEEWGYHECQSKWRFLGKKSESFLRQFAQKQDFGRKQNDLFISLPHRKFWETKIQHSWAKNSSCSIMELRHLGTNPFWLGVEPKNLAWAFFSLCYSVHCSRTPSLQGLFLVVDIMLLNCSPIHVLQKFNKI